MNENQIKYPLKRELDGIYYRVEREGKFFNLCFTDLTVGEQREFLERLNTEGLIRMCHLLAEALRTVGEQFDIFRADK